MFTFYLIILYILFGVASSLDNGLAITPPMGWISWLKFGCNTDCEAYPDNCISDKLFRKMADIMSSEGYLDAGYQYLIIDDCWMAEYRDNKDQLQPDPKRFPNGMKDLADYIHSKGLKFGIYEAIGNYTCSGYPGITLENLEKDAKTFAEWDIDYIKVDGCYANKKNYKKTYTDFGKFLNNTGKPIVYSCSYPYYLEKAEQRVDYSYITNICNLWRNWNDIEDSYSSMINIINWYSMHQERILSYSGFGSWNDPDMLIIGNDDLSVKQSQTQMAFWAMLSAPLIMSADLRTIHPEFKEILLNEDAIAINQDMLGYSGFLMKSILGVDIWVKPLAVIVNDFPTFAVLFYNKNFIGNVFTVSLLDVGAYIIHSYTAYDVFEKSNNQLVLPNENFTFSFTSEMMLYKFIPNGD